MQSGVVYSLNHDCTASLGLNCTPISPINQQNHSFYSVRVHLGPYPPHTKVLKHFIYI